MLWKHLCTAGSSKRLTVSAVELINVLDFLVAGSSVYCAIHWLKVTNDYKKTNRVGQIVSNVSESIKSSNYDLIFLLGLRNVERVSAIHWSLWRYCGSENLHAAYVTPTDIVIVTAENFASDISYKAYFNLGIGGWVLRSCNPLLQVVGLLILSWIVARPPSDFYPHMRTYSLLSVKRLRIEADLMGERTKEDADGLSRKGLRLCKRQVDANE